MAKAKNTLTKRRHPGSSRKKSRTAPKGRQVDTDARGRVLALLGDEPPQRDMLIECLHLIQDHYRCLSSAHLAALAEKHRAEEIISSCHAHRSTNRVVLPLSPC